MRVFTRRIGQSLIIEPGQDMDPGMTVSELFSQGPIEITLLGREANAIELALAVPETVAVSEGTNYWMAMLGAP